MQVVSTPGVSFSGGMPSLKGSLNNSSIDMLTDNKRHMNPTGFSAGDVGKSSSFADVLSKAIGGVENLDVKSQKMTEQAIYDPGSVEAHTLMIAAEKSRFALNLTKTVADGLIRTYRELTSGR